MKRQLTLLLILISVFTTQDLAAQSCANYAIARSTGITYNSIAASSPSYFAWRNTTVNQDDDNRSFAEPIGFDFWYLGIRYTNFSASLNGTIDFSASTSDGNNGGTAPYGPNYNNVFTTANMSMLALAPFYDDLWTAAGGTAPVATGIFYQTSGAAPNRILTVEWKNFDKWNSSTGSVNFQVRMYETTGKIEFIYGTMTAGSGSFAYACGINGSWTSGSPTAAQLLTQQTANSTSFNQTPSNNLATLPASNSRISFTPPLPTGTPTNLSFTAVNKTTMTLHWNDNASNEVGYAIYHSTDNINFIYAGETAANATSIAVGALYPGTVYYWQVHAVTEGDLGTALVGTQATVPAGIIGSTGSGNWGTTATWDCNCIPTLGDNVTIKNGHTVTLNVNGLANMLEIGGGTSGSLIIGNSSTARTLTVDSDIVVHPSATLTTGATAATHSIIIDDDIINNGTIDLAPSGTRVCNVSFNNIDDSDQLVSGSGATTNFNRITVNLSAASKKVEITATHFTAPANFLTLANGYFKLSAAANITPFTGNITIALPTGIELNHASAIMNSTAGSLTLVGAIKITAGTFNIGNATDNNLTFDGGSLTMNGGAMNIAGRMDNLGVTALTNLTVTAGTLTVNTTGSTTAGLAAFHIPETGSAFTMSGGTIIIRRPGAGNLGYINTGGTNGTITGGTIQIGDALTPASQTFLINAGFAIPNLVISNGVAVTAQLLTSALNVQHDITINAGTFNSNSLNITIGGNWINNASFTSGTSTTSFTGTGAQAIEGSSTTTFTNLTINKSVGLASLTSHVIINGILNLAAGKLSMGNYNLTMGNSGSVTGGSVTTYIIAMGTGTLAQHITNGGTKIFPVGTTTAYIPTTVSLTAGSTTDNIHVRVVPTAYSQGSTGSTVTTSAVNATWFITEEIAGGSNATITLQWPSSIEMNGFNRNFSRLAHFVAGIWDYGTTDIIASGSNPYTVTRSGFTSFSPFAVAMLNALPVTWLHFNGTHHSGNNHIEWSTATEDNNHYFSVEYSVNGIHYSEAGRVAGAGTSSDIKKYHYIHTGVTHPVLYYRIKQVDTDAKFSYSKVIKIVTAAPAGFRVSIAAAVGDILAVRIHAGKAAHLILHITDISGRVVYSGYQQVVAGNNNFQLNFPGKAAGVYHLQISDGKNKMTVNRFIKK